MLVFFGVVGFIFMRHTSWVGQVNDRSPTIYSFFLSFISFFSLLLAFDAKLSFSSYTSPTFWVDTCQQ
jgi:hypothetical protein